MKFWVSFIAFCLAITSTMVNAQTLYRTDFDSSSAPMYFTVYGKPEIVGPTGNFSTNSLAFNCSHSLKLPTHSSSDPFLYDQIEYRVDKQGSPFQGLGKSSFKVSFDMITRGLVGSPNQFVVLFDTPAVRNLIFSGEGNIYVEGFKSKFGPISKFTDDQKVHVDIDFDITKDLWKVRIDEKPFFSGVINGNSLTSIRFSHGAKSAGKIDLDATTYIDNVLISIEDPDNKPTGIEGNS